MHSILHHNYNVYSRIMPKKTTLVVLFVGGGGVEGDVLRVTQQYASCCAVMLFQSIVKVQC